MNSGIFFPQVMEIISFFLARIITKGEYRIGFQVPLSALGRIKITKEIKCILLRNIYHWCYRQGRTQDNSTPREATHDHA